MNKIRDEEFIRKFGEHLRKLRLMKNLSQEQLAAKAHIELSQVGRIERGKINTTISTLYALAVALDIDPKDLLDF